MTIKLEPVELEFDFSKTVVFDETLLKVMLDIERLIQRERIKERYERRMAEVGTWIKNHGK